MDRYRRRWFAGNCEFDQHVDIRNRNRRLLLVLIFQVMLFVPVFRSQAMLVILNP